MHVEEPTLPGFEDVEPMPRDAHTDRIDALRHAVADLRARNKTQVQALRQRGEMPSPNAIVMARIDALVTVLFGDDEEGRLRVDYEHERHMSKVLAAAVSRANLRTLEVHDPDGRTGGLFIGR